MNKILLFVSYCFNSFVLVLLISATSIFADNVSDLPKQSSTKSRVAASLEDHLESLVGELSIQLNTTAGIKLAVNDLTYRDTRRGSPAGRYLSDILRTVLSTHPVYSVIGYKDTKSIVGTVNSRGLKVKSRSVDEISLQLGCDLYLKGQYWDVKNQSIQVHALLYTPQNQVKASAMIEIPKNLFPDSIEFLPHIIGFDPLKNHSQTSVIASAPDASKPLRISLKTSRGEEGIYYGGEKFSIFFSFSHPWYARIYYQQSDGSILEIFPDVSGGEGRLEPDRIYSIPDLSKGYEFEVTEPFGFEEVFAVVSKTPMPFPGEIGESEFREYKKSFDDLLKELFPSGELDGETAKESAIITTIPK
jgi:Domain of unknown function (DUF4384)